MFVDKLQCGLDQFRHLILEAVASCLTVAYERERVSAGRGRITYVTSESMARHFRHGRGQK